MPKYELVCEGHVGNSPFDPNWRGERRIFELEAKSEEDVRDLFAKAVKEKIAGVMGGPGLPFRIAAIKRIDEPEPLKEAE